jgi:hypothetical protein
MDTSTETGTVDSFYSLRYINGDDDQPLDKFELFFVWDDLNFEKGT